MAKKKYKLKRSVKRTAFIIAIIVVILLLFNKNSVSDVVTKVEESVVLKKANILNVDKLYIPLESELTLDIKKVELSNDDILSLNDNTIRANKVGSSKVKVIKDNNYQELEIIVTDIISNYQINNKEKLSCNQYSNEEVNKLEEILANQIEFAGTKTRAGVVAAARFLSLEFKYKLNYFYENGRMVTDGSFDYCDGEGRYLHKGLYLTESDYKELKQSRSGPQIWGCLMYEETRKMNVANGLDCSGFVTWSMLNAGYDVDDLGASDLFKLGNKKMFTDDNVWNEIKVGDLVGRNGHVGIIVGIKDDKYYIAEALDYDLHILEYSKNDLINSQLKFFVLMDDYYIENGNLTSFWN